MRRAFRLLALIIASFILIAVALWGCGALLYALPASILVRSIFSGALVAAAVMAIYGGFTGRWLNLAPFVLGFAALLVWWNTILPLQNREWDKVAAHLPVITFAGDIATIDNIRNFTWRSEADADQNWSKRTIDLSKIEAVDLFFSYWAGPKIAHLVVSFPIVGEAPLAFSIEIRREKGEKYSPLAGFFKQYELAIIAAEETDIIRLRTDIWREDVRLYRTGISKAKARRLFRAYAAEIVSLNAKPQFYHTIFSNCTTLAFRFARQIWPELPLDWRILAAGRAPELAYDASVLDSRVPYADIQRLSAISAKAQSLPADADYSSAIRRGVPQPVIEP